MEELKSLRESLKHNYTELFKVIDQRSGLVDQIFKLKKDQPDFLPDLEQDLFNNPKFQKCSIEELLAISLLVEGHAAGNSNYPRWSKKEHLSSHCNEIYEQINPIMLLCNHPELFDQLNFEDDYLFLKNYR